MGGAHKVFDEIPQPSVFDFNAMLRGYSRNGSHREVILLFRRMSRVGVMGNCFTFPVVIKSCEEVKGFMEGEELHCFVVKSGFRGNPFVGTALIDFYAVGGLVKAAYRVFGEMVERNVVIWTSMIRGYMNCGDMENARKLFDLAPERDVVLWNTMLAGYIDVGDMVRAREIFDRMLNKDVMSWNTIMHGYACNGDVREVERLFREMPERNVFSWNALMGVYAHDEQYSEVLGVYKSMLVDGKVIPNDASIVNVLTACARLGALELGKWVDVYAESIGYKENLFIGNALIDMYAKCGVIEDALNVFRSMGARDLISWNTVINGLAVHGRGADALSLFMEMKNAGETPDKITFVGILCACTHMGLVEDGFSYFQSMIDDYSLVPEIEHYGCMVDLLARAGLLDQAVDFVMKMPMKADGVIWACLLGACRVYKNVELGELALRNLAEFEPRNPANYVMLSNIYGDLGKWKDVARLKVAMRDTGFKKSPGCSLIEVNDNVIEFYSLDERHPESELIYGTLRGLTKSLKSAGYIPDVLGLGQSKWKRDYQIESYSRHPQ